MSFHSGITLATFVFQDNRGSILSLETSSPADIEVNSLEFDAMLKRDFWNSFVSS